MALIGPVDAMVGVASATNGVCVTPHEEASDICIRTDADRFQSEKTIRVVQPRLRYSERAVIVASHRTLV